MNFIYETLCNNNADEYNKLVKDFKNRVPLTTKINTDVTPVQHILSKAKTTVRDGIKATVIEQCIPIKSKKITTIRFRIQTNCIGDNMVLLSYSIQPEKILDIYICKESNKYKTAELQFLYEKDLLINNIPLY